MAFYLGRWEIHDRWVDALVLRLAGQSSPVNTALASVVALIPSLIIGTTVFWGLVYILTLPWALSLGFMGAVGTGIYQLGRSDGRREKIRRR